MTESPYITQRQAAEHCNVCISTFRKIVHPIVPKYKIGRRVLYKLVEIDAVLSEQAHKPMKRKQAKADSLVKSNQQIAALAAELEKAS